MILNDWSARDIQAWEYVPLGPFLGKSFATCISAWVVPFEAFAEAEVDLPGQEPAVLPYLQGETDRDAFGLDLHLEVRINGTVVSSPEYRDMYWSPAQMLAHMTVNGASLRVGDLFGSGTVSGAERRRSAACSSAPGTAPSRSPSTTARPAASSRTATSSRSPAGHPGRTAPASPSETSPGP